MNLCTSTKVIALGIAGIAGAMSYGHQVDLLSTADLGHYAYAVPLTVDLLAFIGAMVRHSDTVTDVTRRAALVPLILAGTAAVAANVAVAVNVVQIVVGVWTVVAYLVAEYFVSKLKAKAPAVTVETKAPRFSPERQAEINAKRAATRKRNAAAKRKPRSPVEAIEQLKSRAPVSPAVGYAR